MMLKRASASRLSGEWSDDDFGVAVGRIFKANAAPVGSPWMWTLAFGHHKDRAPTHGYAATREAAMAAFVPQGSRADTRLCCDTRGRDGGLCAMCGRLRVGKENLTWQAWVGAAMCSAFECGSHDRWP
jgi:hypothetical protein